MSLRFEIGTLFHQCEMPQKLISLTCLEEHVLIIAVRGNLSLFPSTGF